METILTHFAESIFGNFGGLKFFHCRATSWRNSVFMFAEVKSGWFSILRIVEPFVGSLFFHCCRVIFVRKTIFPFSEVEFGDNFLFMLQSKFLEFLGG